MADCSLLAEEIKKLTGREVYIFIKSGTEKVFDGYIYYGHCCPPKPKYKRVGITIVTLSISAKEHTTTNTTSISNEVKNHNPGKNQCGSCQYWY